MLPLVVPSTIKFKRNKFFSVIQTKCWCTKAWKSCFAKRALLQHLGATLRGTSCNAWCPLGEGKACRDEGRGWFSEIFLRNGSQKGQMGLQRHWWQERQRIKKGQAGPLKHSLSMKWENKETKQFWFDVLPRHVWSWGNYIFHISRSDQGGNDSRLILITILPPDYHPFPGYSLSNTQQHLLIPWNHNLAP